MAVKKPAPVELDKALQELEGLVGEMEKGELGLEEALRRFERGIALARTCQSALQAAEQKVEKLVESGDGPKTVPLEGQD